ncbi:transcription factor PCF5-like [Panicum miliaceum]|uniref:Transcription factor PCF5-like n=1 Tax=Panicum miliaceum TaxID=4540 RepID=A0A3L6RSH9_PANMI|nr:transcription factor PCF5-like [Panicum miliaceum]
MISGSSVLGRPRKPANVVLSALPPSRSSVHVCFSLHIITFQFYDAQDHLGYDRPSKTVDWLIKNAKDAIDKSRCCSRGSPRPRRRPPRRTRPDSAENCDDQAQAIAVAHTSFKASTSPAPVEPAVAPTA